MNIFPGVDFEIVRFVCWAKRFCSSGSTGGFTLLKVKSRRPAKTHALLSVISRSAAPKIRLLFTRSMMRVLMNRAMDVFQIK